MFDESLFPYTSTDTYDTSKLSMIRKRKGAQSVQKVRQRKSRWEYKPDSENQINPSMPTASKFRERSTSSLKNAFEDIRKGFRENINLKNTIKSIKKSTNKYR